MNSKAVAAQRRRGFTISALLLLVVAIVAAVAANGAATARGATSATLRGTVTGAGKPLADAQVVLYAGSNATVRPLAHATTAGSGSFTISYAQPAAGVLYVDAVPGGRSKLRLRAVVGVGTGGGVPPQTLSGVTVNELTTVAAAYALAQFSQPSGVTGPSPALENAAATAFNLADSSSGKAGAVVTDPNNGASNDTLATLDTLANLVSTCSTPANASACGELLRLATPPGGTTPVDAVGAVVDLARNPTLAPGPLQAIARAVSVYTPALSTPPTAWILTLRYTEPDLFASGRIAIDARENVWSSDNWLPGTKSASTFVTVLGPVGQPILGSPINGGGMEGGAWGIAITPQGTVWVPSFGGDAMSQYSSTGSVLSPSTGWTNGALNHPQGTAIDQKGNLWIANNYGPESAPGQGDVVVYPGGDPSRAITITSDGLNHPFAIQIDGYGRAWISNAGLGGARLVGTRAAILTGKFGGSVTVINSDFKPASFSPIQDPSFRWPLGLAIDYRNDAWAVNYFSSTVTEMRPDGTVAANYKLPHGTLPWSDAVDGSDRVWVAGFATPHVWLLCGSNTAGCPPGASTGEILSPSNGFESRAIQHITSLQIDQSGNVWISNNWSQLDPPVGGVGVAEMIGVATPGVHATPTAPATALRDRRHLPRADRYAATRRPRWCERHGSRFRHHLGRHGDVGLDRDRDRGGRRRGRHRHAAASTPCPLRRLNEPTPRRACRGLESYLCVLTDARAPWLARPPLHPIDVRAMLPPCCRECRLRPEPSPHGARR